MKGPLIQKLQNENSWILNVYIQKYKTPWAIYPVMDESLRESFDLHYKVIRGIILLCKGILTGYAV